MALKRRLLTLATAAVCLLGPTSTAMAGPVETRIEEMEKVGLALKTLNLRTRSQQVSPQKALQAIDVIRTVATNTPKLFEEQDMSGASESKPEIWTDWQDFVARSEELVAYTDTLEGAINDQEQLASAIKEMGAICSACHRRYRE